MVTPILPAFLPTLVGALQRTWIRKRLKDVICASDADMTILSCDGVIFKVHHKHLEVHSDVFAAAENATCNAGIHSNPENDEVVELSESSAVLDLLFQYMYRQPQPDLRSVAFPEFAALAEAVEKYVVYSAMPAIAIQMKESVTEYPLQVLNYASRHSHKALAAEAARLSLGLSLSQAVSILSPDVLVQWATFYDTWHTAVRHYTSFFIKAQSYDNHNLSILATCVRDPSLCFTHRQNLEGMKTLAGSSSIQWAINTLSIIFDRDFMN
ncbi:hypothetical protein R3P38DRAFT_3169349 [Favolaschia claudopus]|uniref:BTB domain-containing protein n=1 Tax=Favolaschia claudopus TaxID=2862362 RepID=A0AAW0E273_9AGAR